MRNIFTSANDWSVILFGYNIDQSLSKTLILDSKLLRLKIRHKFIFINNDSDRKQ